MGSNKTYKICTASETINKMERQPTGWEKIFAHDATDREFHFQNIPTAHTPKQQKTNNPIKKKLAEGLNKYFPKKKYRQPLGTRKLFNISSYQRNANLDYSEGS